MAPAMTPADFIAMGRWHAYAHIQRAGNRVGNNLNQLARNTNRGLDIDVPQLRDALHQYHAVIAAIYEALGMESARDNQGQESGRP